MDKKGKKNAQTSVVQKFVHWFGGDGESRTRVQRKYALAFYMFSCFFGSQSVGRRLNKPIPLTQP